MYVLHPYMSDDGLWLFYGLVLIMYTNLNFKSYKFLCEISQKRNKISFDPDEFIIKTNKKGFIDLIKKKKA